MRSGKASVYLDKLLYFFYTILFVTIICSFRWVSTFVLLLILIASLIKNKRDTGSLLNKKLLNVFIAACCIFYLLQVVSLFYTHNVDETIKHLRVKCGLILIPLTLCCSNFLNPGSVKKLMHSYTWVVASAMMYCFGIALYKYYFLQDGIETFFYHALVTPFHQNAVQVSILLFLGMVYLLETGRKNSYIKSKLLHFILIFYLMFFILFLSSKLIIIFTAGYFLYYFIISFKKEQKTILIAVASVITCIAIAFVLLTNNPVSKRFNEIINGDNGLVSRQSFTPGIYFNGLQFRLLQWRFVAEILEENHAWLMGVTPGDAQTLLDNKYLSTNMYVGENNNGGFLGYNTHNQFLQSTLQSGILGLLSFVLICITLVRLAVYRKNRLLSSAILLSMIFALNDSYFESQYGLILFTFFPLFFYYGSDSKLKQSGPGS